VVLTPVCGLFHMQKARHVNKDTTYSEERFEHEIRVYDSIDSRYILEDLIAKLTLNYKG
jgi:purine nucleosidase